MAAFLYASADKCKLRQTNLTRLIRLASTTAQPWGFPSAYARHTISGAHTHTSLAWKDTHSFCCMMHHRAKVVGLEQHDMVTTRSMTVTRNRTLSISTTTPKQPKPMLERAATSKLLNTQQWGFVVFKSAAGLMHYFHVSHSSHPLTHLLCMEALQHGLLTSTSASPEMHTVDRG